jgi:hypothetical protein
LVLVYFVIKALKAHPAILATPGAWDGHMIQLGLTKLDRNYSVLLGKINIPAERERLSDAWCWCAVSL